MATHTSTPLSQLAQAAAEASRELAGFDATETVEAGPIRVVARVGRHRPDRVAVEYESVVNPWVEMEERLAGDVELTAEELVGMSLHYDGTRTWLYDASTNVCLVKPGRILFEPLPDLSVLAETDYLRELVHDYLLRDLGTETLDGREARVVAMKPKHAQRVHAFKRIAFLARKISVALDAETLFPVRLAFAPARASQTHQLIGADAEVTVRYAGLRLSSDPPAPFAPPEGAKVFREDWTPLEQLPQRVPFPLSFDAFFENGYTSLDGAALLCADDEHGRAYVVATFVRASEADDARTGYVTVRVGNYLSRNMSRRRVLLAESGDELTLDGHTARFFDRRSLWEQHAAELDLAQAPRELMWERDGVFWFVTGIHVGRDDLERVAGAAIAPRTAPPSAPTGEPTQADRESTS